MDEKKKEAKEMSKLARIKQILLTALDDSLDHTADDLREIIKQNNIEITAGDSSFRTAIFQLRNSGYNIVSKERGTYKLVKNKSNELLDNFFIIEPEEKKENYCVYIHNDGKIVLNGRLNHAIDSKEIEIRISSDGEQLALIANGTKCHKFTKSGYSQNQDLLKIVKKKRVSLPACFNMEFNPVYKMWIGKINRTPRKTKTQNK